MLRGLRKAVTTPPWDSERLHASDGGVSAWAKCGFGTQIFTSLWLFGKQSRGVHIGGHRVFHDLAAGVGNIGIPHLFHFGAMLNSQQQRYSSRLGDRPTMRRTKILVA